MKRAWPTVVLALTFVLGMAAGLGVAPLLRPHPRAGLPPGMEALSLRPDQEQKIQSIVAQHEPEVQAALGDAMPRLHAIQEKVAGEIEGVLDPDQRAAFKKQREAHGAGAPPHP